MGNSILWSYVGYGFVVALLAFIGFLLLMMILASKDDKKGHSALPVLGEDQAEAQDDDEEFFFESGLDQPQQGTSTTAPKKPTRSFFKKDGSTVEAPRSGSSDVSFFEHDEFDLTEGSDLDSTR